MKDKVPAIVESYRVTEGPLGSDESYGFNGAFNIPCGNFMLSVIISDEMGWDHASISLPFRTPSWGEMCHVKRIFWKPEETVVQFHPAEGDYKNYHKFCLHLWKKQGEEYELPPSCFVAP